MRNSLLLVFLSTILAGCEIQFDKDYYERISGIQFPAKYKVLETFDNVEFLTGTVFQIDSLTLLKFSRENHLDTLQSLQDLRFFGENYFKQHKPIFYSAKNIYFLTKSKDKNDWFYIADLNQQKLWAIISYPDWSGD